ncbi:MAG TPA: septal ring lytic transglycosylase RlpA family protein [Woeseiaceae bacterium]|nr:septal ring lytic transglycosylase RlpA family protein [Woeseiaceae bacterium]
MPLIDSCLVAARRQSAFLLLATLAACGGTEVRDPSAPGSVVIPDVPGSAVPRAEALSRYGNGPVYQVLGKTYTVLPSSSGYQERGVASWYGDDFHGKPTSSRETYDMHAMTAAHKTLPLPTYVRVRNLRNNKSVVVRVNDRGPFVHNRIIDLSYAAALKLDMVADGTSLVEVTAIGFDAPSGDVPVRVTTPATFAAAAPAAGAARASFVQVGAFGNRENADRRRTLLVDGGVEDVVVYADDSVTPPLYRVRIGPIYEVVQFDEIVTQLERLGITDPYLVGE